MALKANKILPLLEAARIWSLYGFTSPKDLVLEDLACAMGILVVEGRLDSAAARLVRSGDSGLLRINQNIRQPHDDVSRLLMRSAIGSCIRIQHSSYSVQIKTCWLHTSRVRWKSRPVIFRRTCSCRNGYLWNASRTPSDNRLTSRACRLFWHLNHGDGIAFRGNFQRLLRNCHFRKGSDSLVAHQHSLRQP